MKETTTPSKFHPFSKPIADVPLPEEFTYPFHYTPHPLCVMAAGEVQAYLETQSQWQQELKCGKMFGVLVVKDATGNTGYLAAFSGILAGENNPPFFVPPIYDLQQPKGFFRIEEEKISAINARIGLLENAPDYLRLKQRATEEADLASRTLTEAKADLQKAREIREHRRQNTSDAGELEKLTRESQYQKAEFKRLKQRWEKQLAALQMALNAADNEIEWLKTERKNRSAALQQKLFEQFNLLNGNGESRKLCDIFEQTAQKTPPAGAGECAAPKMLQYAYQNRLHPITMAEFWWGDSPRAEIRRHGYYYPACQGKCGPILSYMLQGLKVEANPLASSGVTAVNLEILYEDEWLVVVNKSAGLLSVPGKSNAVSIYQLLKERYPTATGPLLVHRLDMATSGLILAAKTKDVHCHLQAQFKKRTVKKRYVALLDGIVPADEGIIDLPVCVDLENRPQQMVSPEYGKPAITRYRVLERQAHRTRIIFYPLTGRTHQLRVHAAHPLGLNSPIAGDELYGKKADRLYLHAEYLEFQHPVSGKMMKIEKKAEF